MTLKYADQPQIWYTKKSPYEEPWQARFPSHSRPIATAPERSASPVWIYEPDGSGHWALFHRGQWQKLELQRDPDGAARVRMSGEAVNNPVRWLSS